MANEKPVLFVSDAAKEDGFGYGNIICAVGNNVFGAGGACKGALRFTSVDIGQGETLNMCLLKYEYGSVGSSSGSWKHILYGMDEDNTGDFSSNPFGRTKTTASITTDEGAPTSGGAKTFDVKNVAQEIVNRGGWARNNAMGFMIEDNGTSAGVYATCAGGSEESYLVYRISAEPDFTPTPVSVTAPSLPTPEDYGIKISMPGVDVRTATDQQLFYTSKKYRFKVLVEGEKTTDANPYIIAHGLSYTPFAEVFVKSGTRWYRLPYLNYSLASNIGYASIDATNLNVYVPIGSVIYYYIFVEQLL